MAQRFLVHFEVTSEIEISVLVKENHASEDEVVKIARQKLKETKLQWPTDMPCVVDVLE